jgi:hypothetical protein
MLFTKRDGAAAGETVVMPQRYEASRRWRGRIGNGRLSALVLAAALGSACSASVAQDGGIDQLVARADDGATIVLPAGSTGRLTIERRSFSPAITIDASAAVLTGVVLNRVDGVTIRGGAIIGPGGRSYGVSIRNSGHISVRDMTISGAHRGVVVNDSHDVELIGLNLTGLISDGINVALSRRVVIERNRCRNFTPRIATYAADGSRIRDGDHPDCIQAWSRPTRPPSADISVIDNDIDGAMQGIFFGNHVRGGVDDGGFDNIIIRNNRVRVGYPNGIVLGNVRNATITGNQISTTPGAVMPNRPSRRITANMRFSGVGITACNNAIVDQAGARLSVVGTLPC